MKEQYQRSVDFAKQEHLTLLILGIIAGDTMRPGRGCYIASWDIIERLEALGYKDVSIASHIPRTIYDEALQSLIDEKIVEEVPDLHLRYQLKRR